MLFSPTNLLKAVGIPKLDLLNLFRPFGASRKVELVAQVVVEIEAVVDDVRLMDGLRQDACFRVLLLVDLPYRSASGRRTKEFGAL